MVVSQAANPKASQTPKGTPPEEQLRKGGKWQGKRGSANKPKEPPPPSKPKDPAVTDTSKQPDQRLNRIS